MKTIVLACALFGLASPAAPVTAQKPTTYTCTATPDPSYEVAPNYVGLEISGTAPRKADVYLRIRTATSVEPVWTDLHNIRGVVGPDYTVRVLYAGDYVAQLIDASKSDLSIGYYAVFAECAFTIQPAPPPLLTSVTRIAER